MEYPEVGRIEVEEKAVLPEKTEIPQTGEPVLGVIFEHISSSYGLQIMHELEQLARKAGYHLYPCFSYGNQELETQAIRYLRGIGAKGMFVMPCHGSYVG